MFHTAGFAFFELNEISPKLCVSPDITFSVIPVGVFLFFFFFFGLDLGP